MEAGVLGELFSAQRAAAAAEFLAGYSGLTREAYTSDPRQYVAVRRTAGRYLMAERASNSDAKMAGQTGGSAARGVDLTRLEQ